MILSCDQGRDGLPYSARTIVRFYPHNDASTIKEVTHDRGGSTPCSWPFLTGHASPSGLVCAGSSHRESGVHLRPASNHLRQLTASGLVGLDLNEDQGLEAARVAVLNALAAIASVAALDDIVRVVHVTGYVASADGFTD